MRSLAAGVSLSPSRFCAPFHRTVRCSPMNVLRGARLRHAARLLEETGRPRGRCLGIRRPFHFGRLFRQRFGTPPGAYRSSAEAPAGEFPGVSGRTVPEFRGPVPV
ncbi:helix-turn-helix domain-containing protein [Streptomyces sp. MI02-2A]|uniref:helix-turn-helix domain-containing protein n=1 Tax=Streptomyces sp. MI02-2A TaxID=3028688 RepID=UPI0029C08E69|nr:helix-turn-helix domain-containing protein [Streptomyces sp. MI02-2A]